jgi:NADH:ubiquinone oxidoreductase subunit 4 (subunit M)
MEILNWVIAGLFLPLFPLGMLFNAIFQRLHAGWMRALLLLLWPLPGIWLVAAFVPDIPDWVALWALFSAVLYGFRAVVVRECGMWTGFLATSSWALGWILMVVGGSPDQLLLQVLAFSLPLALLMLLTTEVTRRYESAYAGIVSGLAQAQPRLSMMLVLAMLAVIGSPLFPAFFTMLSNITHAITVLPGVAVGLVLVWLLWSWSAMRLLQELLVGPAHQLRHEDIGHGTATFYGVSLLLLVGAGLYLSGVLL